MTTDATPEEAWECSWLVQVPSGNPEPDFAEDCYLIIPCGARTVPVGEGWACDAGHRYLGLEAESRLDWFREEAERRGIDS